MTENEAIKVLEKPSKHIRMVHKTKNEMEFYTFSSDLVKAFEMAIQALEEMQKIKALGDCYIIPKNSTWEVNGIDIHKALEEIQQYREIGTVEKIKEELDKLRNDNECQGLYFTLEERKALAKQSRELSEYKGIGTIEEFKVLKNTDIPIIHGKAELDLNDNEVRNKAIDEFVIKLKRVRGYGLITNFDRPFGVTFNKLDEIAEEMRGAE